jgi:hypothetical protein
MIKKILFVATIIVASSLSLDTDEAQAQSWRSYNRRYSNGGLNAHVYRYPTNRGVVYSSRSYFTPMLTPYSTYTSGYRNYSGYGVPNRYGYGNNLGQRFGYGFPGSYGNRNGYGYQGVYGYRNNFNNYGFGPNSVNRYSRGLSGYGIYRRYGY